MASVQETQLGKISCQISPHQEMGFRERDKKSQGYLCSAVPLTRGILQAYQVFPSTTVDFRHHFLTLALCLLFVNEIFCDENASCDAS